MLCAAGLNESYKYFYTVEPFLSADNWIVGSYYVHIGCMCFGK